MGLSIVASDALFTALIGTTVLPVTLNKQAEFYFGSTLAKSMVNKANGVSGTAVGSPTINAYSAVFGDAGYIDSGVSLTGYNTTFIAVAKKNVAGGAIVMGQMTTFNANSTTGDNLIWGSLDGGASDNLLTQSNSSVSASRNPISTSDVTDGNFHMIVGRLNDVTLNTQYPSIYKTAGTISSATPADSGNRTGSPVVTATLKLGHGSANMSQYAGTIEIASCAYYNRVLTDAEIQACYNFYKSYYAGKITMV